MVSTQYLVGKVKNFERELYDPRASRVDKRRALRFLVHLLQDIHQPFHVGDTGSRGFLQKIPPI